MRTLIWILVAGCAGQAELVTSDCAGGECPTCEADAECTIAHNPCHETAICGHVDEQLVVDSIGCSAALEHATPPASDCTCVVDRCTAAGDAP
ncbi:MAG: hypothetical protein H6737_14405 [Alphaproteobacteria bacterium]|nr:hypothetical protein [Alphaproteobacteria bacterium]